jgi:hypothetical protein
MSDISMTRHEDQINTSGEEQKALERFVQEHPESTLLREERTAKYVDKERLSRQGESPTQWSEIEGKIEQRAAQRKRDENELGADWELLADLMAAGSKKPIPKTPSSALWEPLEAFVNLPPDADIRELLRRYPDFFPPFFYTLQPDNMQNEDQLRSLRGWESRNAAVTKILRVWCELLREAWKPQSQFHPEYVAQLANIPVIPIGEKEAFTLRPVCDAQRAVLQMMLDSWRARECLKCGRPFVARKAKGGYCSDECQHERRHARQLASKRYRRLKRSQLKARKSPATK